MDDFIPLFCIIWQTYTLRGVLRPELEADTCISLEICNRLASCMFESDSGKRLWLTGYLFCPPERQYFAAFLLLQIFTSLKFSFIFQRLLNSFINSFKTASSPKLRIHIYLVCSDVLPSSFDSVLVPPAESSNFPEFSCKRFFDVLIFIAHFTASWAKLVFKILVFCVSMM